MKKEEQCLVAGCKGVIGGKEKRRGGRGLCRNCYATAYGLVKSGKVSWEELESLGLARSASESLFIIKLRELQEKRGKGIT